VWGGGGGDGRKKHPERPHTVVDYKCGVFSARRSRPALDVEAFPLAAVVLAPGLVRVPGAVVRAAHQTAHTV
jgi:hypothetical protein